MYSYIYSRIFYIANHFILLPFLSFYLFYWIYLKRTGSHQGPHEKRLLNHLLLNYNTLERPVSNESDALTVRFGLTLQQIIDVVCFALCVCARTYRPFTFHEFIKMCCVSVCAQLSHCTRNNFFKFLVFIFNYCFSVCGLKCSKWAMGNVKKWKNPNNTESFSWKMIGK